MWFEYGRYPISQCWKLYADDEPVHMVDRVVFYARLKTRCGWYYDLNGGSQSWTTSEAPTCPDCLEWLREYLTQESLPFPNGYDEWGRWAYLPSIGKPLPKWGNLLSSRRLRSLIERRAAHPEGRPGNGGDLTTSSPTSSGAGGRAKIDSVKLAARGV